MKILLPAGLLLLFASLQTLLSAQTILNDDLVAYYTFSGNAADESTNVNNGLIAGATPIRDRLNVDRHAYSFDGVNNFIVAQGEHGMPVGTNAFSITLWLYVDQGFNDSYRFILGNDNAGAWGLFLQPALQTGSVSTNSIVMYIGNNESEPSLSVDWILGKWYHVAATYDGQEIRFYRDGELIGSSKYNGNNRALPGSRRLRIGNRLEGNQPFKGGLDDIRIYGHALAATEIGEIYSFEKNPSGPRRAFASAQVTDGFLTRIIISDPGNQYSEPPIVLVEPPGEGGSPAVLEAVVSDGRVVSVIVKNPGAGYLLPPKVSIASPPPAFDASLSVEYSRIMVNLRVKLGARYVLQSASILGIWTTVREFTASDEDLALEFEIKDTGQFFRVVQL